MKNKMLFLIDDKVLSRREYQEILLARMAGGDMYASELRAKIRAADKALDRLRVACGGKALYEDTRPDCR